VISLTLFIDVHEPVRIQTMLEQSGILVERKQLPVGDYVFGEVAIERKTVSDLMGSIYDSRLWDQMYNISSNFDKPILIVVGSIPPVYRWIRSGSRVYKAKLSDEDIDKRENTILSVLATVSLSYNVHTFNVVDREQFVKLVTSLYLKHTKKTSSLKPVRRKGSTLLEIKSNMLCQIPSIGRSTADLIAKDFSLSDLCSMSPKTMSRKIKGLGIKRASKILECLTN